MLSGVLAVFIIKKERIDIRFNTLFYFEICLIRKTIYNFKKALELQLVNLI
jgi:hypothetical protein